MNKLIIFLTAFAVACVLGPIIIPFLHKIKFGQSIRDEGPSWHQKKSGTPTMGGFIFIIALLIGMLVMRNDFDRTAYLALFCSLGFGLIGFIDDFIKVVLKRNLGLRAWQKFALQILVSVIFVFGGLKSGIITTVVSVPFTSLTADLGAFYIPLAIFVLLAVTNSVNLTDGLDGLATCITIVVMLFFAVVSLIPSVSLFAYAVTGALFGFLIFNKYPAKVFMGDTGSLFLGGAVSACAILIGNPFILIIVGFVYLCETLSVIIQVISFKTTGKRVFKMSPIHHHFEMCGWNEVKIVSVFTAVTFVLCVISFLFMR